MGNSRPSPPADAPQYVVEGLDRQDAETLRELAQYADRLADWKDRDVERELSDRELDRELDEVPCEWDEEAWQDAVDDTDAPPKATLTTKRIDGRDYYYLQWREGDKIKSEYVAPVIPAGSG